MIGRLKGTIDHREADGAVIIDVQGVGYEVYLPVGASAQVAAAPGDLLTLYIHTHVREDAITLFGFGSAADRGAFRALLKVNSIGPKLALAIVGVMNAGELRDAIVRHDKAAFKGITGVGRKTVERILVDLQDKLSFAPENQTNVRLRAVPAKLESAADTVVGALVQMGYKRAEAEAAVDASAPDENQTLEQLLRAALSALS